MTAPVRECGAGPGTLAVAPPERLAVKLYVADPETFDRQRPIEIFHRWIQEDAIPGLPIDVHDYTHMPDGPGVLLVTHEGHLRTDETDRRIGLEYEWKRRGKGTLGQRVLKTLTRTLDAAARLEAETADDRPIRFDPRELRLRFTDRLAVPTTDEAFGEVRSSLAEVLSGVYPGAALTLGRAGGSRAPLTVRITAKGGNDPDLSTMAERVRQALAAGPDAS